MPLLSSSFLNRRKASPIGSRSWTRIRKGIRSSIDLRSSEPLPARIPRKFRPEKAESRIAHALLWGAWGWLDKQHLRACATAHLHRNSTPQTGRQGQAFSLGYAAGSRHQAAVKAQNSLHSGESAIAMSSTKGPTCSASQRAPERFMRTL